MAGQQRSRYLRGVVCGMALAMEQRSRHLRGVVCGMALAMLFVASSGCFLWTSRGEGDRLLRATEKHERRLAALESGVREERERLRQQVEEARQQVSRLREVLQQATDVVTRNSADLGLEVRRLRERLDATEGRLAELEQALRGAEQRLRDQRRELSERITHVARRAGVEVPLRPDEVPAEADAHLRAADQAQEAGEKARARALWKEFVARHPADERADDVLVRLGRSYLADDRPATALGVLRRILAEYAEGDRVHEALLLMGEAFFRLGSCTDAKSALQAVTQARRAPRDVKRAARSLLRDVQRAPRERCRR